MKRIWILALAVLMLVFAPNMLLRAEAAEIVDSGTCGENVTWTLDSDGLLTISGSGDMDDYDYSWYFSDEAPWYSQRSSILSVVVEDGVTSIGDSAFYDCASLSSITIPGSVTSIGEDAFYVCTSLSSITIPAGVTSIGEDAFYNCVSLSSITIPDSVTSIGHSAFYGCVSLTSITIPEGVTSIGDYAFRYCRSLSSITIPDSVTSIGCEAFQYCSSLSSITIPDSVTSIGCDAFWNCNSLRSVTIPNSVTSIDECAFYGCHSLRSVVIGNGVTSIGYRAFAFCDNLSCVTIAEGVTRIDEDVFYGCSGLTDIILPESILLIRAGAFEYCEELNTVHYAGTREQAAEITILSNNGGLPDATWHYECSGENCIEQESPFGDVAADAYYFNPVLWAVENGITNGLSADTFGPEATCTRGQIVTFLWRACGSPEPNMAFNPFSDVSTDDYFYDAVLWAVEKGITSGMGDGTFAPGAACTRGQVATFLWRSQGKPYSYAENIFDDIAYGAYYYDAVLWAVENGITNGMGDGTFAPDATCTRGQIVTFLYRAMA